MNYNMKIIKTQEAYFKKSDSLFFYKLYVKLHTIKVLDIFILMFWTLKKLFSHFYIQAACFS
ncbi:hypothetical protein TPHV1_280004 [Treponema phagedenis]|uniref:Uncharacterized protein n=1 Tax=Treponema phagedenis TaxID=162 RepID=A0A0B7GWY6_TREPH|nr:hypothetical protein TPHV1_280004 [Treponema phagedenis]